MPNTQQAVKRLRQAATRNLRNRASKSEIKTLTKKVLEAIANNDAKTAREILKVTQAKLDKAGKKGVLHKNTVARRKSLLARKLNDMSA